MAFLDLFRFSFKPDSTHWYYWDNGSIGISDTAQYSQAPDKWRESEVKWKRSDETRGLHTSIASPYDFVDQTATLLRTQYYNGTIDTKVYFLIERLNLDTMQYEDFFDGEIDLSTFRNGTIYNGGSLAVNAAAIQGGIATKLDAAANVPQRIVLETADCDYIKMDGLKLRGTFHYLVLNFSTGTTTGANSLILPDVVYTLTEGDYPIATPTPIVSRIGGGLATNGNFGGAVSPAGAYASLILEAQQDMDIRVTFTIPNFYYSNTSSTSGRDIQLKMQVIVIPETSSPFSFTQQVTVYTDPNGVLTQGNNRTLPSAGGTTPLLSINANDRVYVAYFFEQLVGTTASWDYHYDEGTVAIVSEFRNSLTTAAAYPLRTVVEKMLTSITGQTGLLSSGYLNHPTARWHHMNPYNVRLTCGDAIRNITTNPAGLATRPAIQLTWAELVRYLKYAHGCGMDIRDGQVVIERMEYFFDDSTTIADVGETKTFVDGPAREFMKASGKWGYPVKDYDKLNGKDEPNTTVTWKYPVNAIPEQEDATVNIRTDPYGIEEARANLSGKKSVDANTDNDTFAIETEDTAVSTTWSELGLSFTVSAYPLYRPQNSVTQPATTGFIFIDTMYNLTMLPILNLRRNGSWIRSMLYNYPNPILKFQATDKNPVITVDLGGGVINAVGDVVVEDLDEPFFKPQALHIEAVLPNTYLQSMRANPSGCIEFTEKGTTYRGYPLEVGVKGPDDNSYNMTLLCTADTDLLPRIE